MKVVILAGGFGTRITEESHLKPKPMVEIGGKPILWHIMKEYSNYGFNEFIICLGYKGYAIKQFFADYFLYTSDITVDLEKNEIEYHSSFAEPWKITLVETGLNTLTGGRIKRIQKYVGNEPFMLTYGDGVSDVNIKELLEFHKKNKKKVTLTAVKVEERFGVLKINNKSEVTEFREKSELDSSLINGGYMVLEPSIFEYIKGDDVAFEKEPLKKLAEENEVSAYKHEGFWKCMDTLRDKNQLEELWNSGNAKWKTWE